MRTAANEIFIIVIIFTVRFFDVFIIIIQPV